MKSRTRLLYVIKIYFLLLTRVKTQLYTDFICEKLSRSPNFQVDMVLGVSWRYYYTWVLDMGDRCLDVKFVRATSSDRDRIGMNMIEYMRDTLPWEAATLMLSITPAVILQDSKPREVLLIPVEGKQGRFRGVPNMAQNVDFQLPKYSMPASNRLLKLYREGKFLLMADCDTGVAALLARVDQSVYWSEILSTAEEVWQKEGFPACTVKNENEIEGSLFDMDKLNKTEDR